MITLTVSLAKGGATKTHMAVHHAVGFAARGLRTLLVDLDPQGDSTLWLLGRLQQNALGAADALLSDDGATADHLVPVKGRPRLAVMPRTPKLGTVEHELANEPGGHEALRFALEPLKDKFDVVVVDTGPTLGLLTVGGLLAATGVLVPVEPSDLSLAGLARLDEMLQRLRKRARSTAELLGYVLVRADAREAITEEIRGVLERQAKGKVYKTAIRTNTLAKSLMSQQATFLDEGADAKGAKDYTAVLDETMQRLGLSKPAARRRK